MDWLTRERAAWGAIAIFAAVTRFGVSGTPLSNGEAESALRALALLRGEAVTLLNPLFETTQAALFALFGASDLAARLPAALAGVALCLLPLLLKPALGSAQALLMAALLALSPTLWFVAQNGSGASVAWTLAVLALSFAQRAQWTAAGASTGVLMSCGYDAVLPALIALFTLILRGYARRLEGSTFGIAVVVGFLLASTGLGWRWQGIGDAFDGYARWGAALGDPRELSFERLFAGFALDDLLLWTIGLVGLALALLRRPLSDFSRDHLALLGFGVVTCVLFPEPANVMPLAFGLSAFGGKLLRRVLDASAEEPTRELTLTTTAVTLLALAFGALGLRQYGNGQLSGAFSAVIAFAVVLGLFALGGLWMAYGSVSRGIALAVLVALVGYSLWAGLRQTWVNAANPAEAYRAEAIQPGLGALTRTLRVLSTRATGEPAALQLSVPDDAPAALRWALREWTTDDERTASAFLTPGGAPPPTRASLVGHTFEVLKQAGLSEIRCGASVGCLPLARWVAFREGGNAQPTRWTLWIRSETALRASGYR